MIANRPMMAIHKYFLLFWYAFFGRDQGYPSSQLYTFLYALLINLGYFIFITLMLKDNKDSPETKLKQYNKSEKRSSSHSSSQSKQQSASQSDQHPKKPPENNRQGRSGKLFISYLDANQSVDALEQQIRQLLGKKYQLQKVEVRKSRNGYSYAFVDVREADKIDEIISEFNDYKLNGKRIVVERKRIFGERPPRSGNCYKCGKEGHIARECRIGKRGSSEEKKRKSSKHRKRESSSQSCQRDRNKSKKRRYRTRDKKHEKLKKLLSSSSSSDSSSSSESSVSSSSSSENRKRRAKRRVKRQKNKMKQAKRKQKSKAKKQSSQSE